MFVQNSLYRVAIFSSFTNTIRLGIRFFLKESMDPTPDDEENLISQRQNENDDDSQVKFTSKQSFRFNHADYLLKRFSNTSKYNKLFLAFFFVAIMLAILFYSSLYVFDSEESVETGPPQQNTIMEG